MNDQDTKKSDLEDQEKKSRKDASSKFDSYYTVAKDKLGRDPTFEEVVQMMGEKEEVETDGSGYYDQAAKDVMGDEELDKTDDLTEEDPAILRYRVYFGMKDGDQGKEPNRDKILFYEDPQTGACYDCESTEWLESRPSFLDHLPSRPINFEERDIVSAIVHGIMEEKDYEMLSKKDLIGDIPKTLWEKYQNLNKHLTELEEIEAQEMKKSSESEIEMVSDDEGEETLPKKDIDSDSIEDETPDPLVIDTPELPEDLKTDDSLETSQEFEMPGEDVMMKIMEESMKFALTNMEDQIRRIVEEVVSGKSRETEQDHDDDFIPD